jgi:hypothetical protein
VKSENTFLEFYSNNLCSINLAPSKDGGTHKRKLNERETKMHNLKTKCEKEIVKITSIDGFLVSTNLYKIKK